MKSVKEKHIKRVNIHFNDALGSLLKVKFYAHEGKLLTTFKRSEDMYHKANRIFVSKLAVFEV